MREQLPKILQYFHLIPSWISLILFGSLLFSGFVMSNYENSLSSLFFILSLIFLILFFGKVITDTYMKKFRLGSNPLYLVKRYPKDLQGQINQLKREKFELIGQTQTSAQFERRIPFDVGLFIGGLMLGTIPAIIYVVWYFLQPKERVFLDVTTQ